MVQGGEVREETNVIQDVERDEEVDVKTRSESSMVAMAYALLVALLLAYVISLVVRRSESAVDLAGRMDGLCVRTRRVGVVH